MTITLAILGGIIFSQLTTIPPSISFIIGVFTSICIFKFASKNNTETITLYVGNLPYKANEVNVKELFSKHAEVFAVRLMKDKRTGKRKGVGFIVIASDDATKTINALNGIDYMQRTLKVRIANDPKHIGVNES
ncbi:RNA-binding protein [Candidatus Photodesmus katoptron]|uniref:RNA recognition motif containing protein n=2 Tax=Candidatus Photodesmus anomalopis TaxID=28176 RepID=S3EGL8_9GAMM|nr:RNA recognition motif containing protein [Candidatus Photodesmus katoptron Akat1]KEY90041.1 RNA-binding protein [Candidatus Photodesmus katoptron]